MKITNREKNILVVENDETTAIMIKQILTKYNYNVLDLINSGSKALEFINSVQPDLIIIGIHLPGEFDGITTVQQIQADYSIPHVFITETCDQDIIERAKKTTPYGFLLKPFDKNMLNVTIEMALHKYASENKYRIIEKKYNTLLTSLPDINFNINNHGEILDSFNADSIWTPAIAAKAVPYIKKTIDEQQVVTFDYVLKKSGELYYYEARFIYVSSNKILTFVRDVTRLKNAEKQIEHYKNQIEKEVLLRTRELENANKELVNEIHFRKMIENNLNVFSHAINLSPNLIIIINQDGYVQYINAKFIHVSGYELDDLLDKSVKEEGNSIIPDQETWKKIIEQEQWQGELNSVSKNGKMYYLKASVSKIKDDTGATSYYIITADDITEKKREKLLMDQIKTALDKSQLDAISLEMDWKDWKEKIMNRNISRTDKSLFKNIHNSFTQGAGFGTMISLLEMLAMTAKKQDDKYLVDSKMFSLIQENLAIAQNAFKTFTNIDWIISNNFEMEIISCRELYEFTLGIKSKAQELCHIKNQTILINEFNHAFTNLYLNINKEHYFKALYEIMINAMKFSKESSHIIVMIYHIKNYIVISTISDPEKPTGDNISGIPAEYSKVIFEPFYRLSKIVYEKYKTLDFGLGLTLVEKIITKHGGEITAQNILDHTDIKREAQTKVNISISLPLIRE